MAPTWIKYILKHFVYLQVRVVDKTELRLLLFPLKVQQTFNKELLACKLFL